MDFREVHSWFDLLGVGVMAAGLIVPAWLAASRGRKATIQGDKVLDQVRNGHTDTNLRDDLDRIHADVEEVLIRVVRLEQRFNDHVDPPKPTGLIQL